VSPNLPAVPINPSAWDNELALVRFRPEADLSTINGEDMSRSDVTNIGISYSGSLEDLAAHFQLQEITYYQEMIDGRLEEYVCGRFGVEVIEAIRPLGDGPCGNI